MALHKEWLLPFAAAIRKHKVTGPAYGFGDQQTLFTPKYALAQLNKRGLIADSAAEPAPDHCRPTCISFRSLVGLLGIQEYEDIDINGRARINLDLSKPAPPEMFGSASAVFELGTLEHIFDVA